MFDFTHYNRVYTASVRNAYMTSQPTATTSGKPVGSLLYSLVDMPDSKAGYNVGCIYNWVGFPMACMQQC
jgi:hypothetical protein